MTERYHASDGSLWNVYYDPPPVSPRHCGWTWVHGDYDGAPDAHDDRHGTAPTHEAAIAAVEEWVAENAAERTQESAPLRRTHVLLDYVRGHASERDILHGILCRAHGQPDEDRWLLDSMFVDLRIAARLDDLSRQAASARAKVTPR